MKVVINKCYGGFGLSDKAIKRCIELGMTVSNERDKSNTDFVFYKKKSFGTNYHIKNCSKEFRSNPILIKVIEELKEEANGSFAKLRIVEIPFDGLDGWDVDEYDGIETIEEDHQSWG